MFDWVMRMAMRNPGMRRRLWRAGITGYLEIAYSALPATAREFTTDQIMAGSITKEHIYNYFALRPIVRIPNWMKTWLQILFFALVIGVIAIIASPRSIITVFGILVPLYVIVGGIIALNFYSLQAPLRAYNARETISDGTYDRLKECLHDLAQDNAARRLYIEDDVKAALFERSVANLLEEKVTLDNQVNVGQPIFVAAIGDVEPLYFAQRVTYKTNAKRGSADNAPRFRVYRRGTRHSEEEIKARKRWEDIPFASGTTRVDFDGNLRFRLLGLIWLIPLEDQLCYYRLPVDTLQGVEDAKADEEYKTERYFYQDVVGITTQSGRTGARPDDKERPITVEGGTPGWSMWSRLILSFQLSLKSGQVVPATYGTRTEYNDPVTGDVRAIQLDDKTVEEHIHSLNSFIIQKKNQSLRAPVQTPGTYLPNMAMPGGMMPPMMPVSPSIPLMTPQASQPGLPQPPQPVWDPTTQQWVLPPQPPQPVWDPQLQQWVLPQPAAMSTPPAAPAASPVAPPSAEDDTLASLAPRNAPATDMAAPAGGAGADGATVPVASDGEPAVESGPFPTAADAS